MMTWPADLPQMPLLRGFSVEQEDNRIVFQVEVGPPKMRRRTSARTQTLSIIMLLDWNQRIYLKRFFERDLSDGAEVFEYRDPIEGDVGRFCFKSTIRYTPVRSDLSLFEVGFQLSRLP